MNYRWLLILNNLSGISYVQIFSRNKWKESVFLRIYAFVKLLIIILCRMLILVDGEKIKKFLRTEKRGLKSYSSFSRNILLLSFNFFRICGCIIIIIQYIRRWKVLRFLKAIESFKLSEESRTKLRNKCIVNTLFNVGVFLVGVLIRNFVLFDTKYLFSYVIYYEILQGHLVILTIINLFCNFQQFIVIALKEVINDIQNNFFSEKRLEKSLESLMKIEHFLQAFEKTFGTQLTLVTVNCVFLFVTFVSFQYSKPLKIS